MGDGVDEPIIVVTFGLGVGLTGGGSSCAKEVVAEDNENAPIKTGATTKEKNLYFTVSSLLKIIDPQNFSSQAIEERATTRSFADNCTAIQRLLPTPHAAFDIRRQCVSLRQIPTKQLRRPLTQRQS